MTTETVTQPQTPAAVTVTPVPWTRRSIATTALIGLCALAATVAAAVH
jgi:hypothetical protein